MTAGSTLTVDQFRELIDTVKTLDKLGRDVLKVRDGDTQRELSEVAAEAEAQTANLPKRDPETNRGLGRIEEAWVGLKSKLRSGFASMLKVEQMCDWLDDGKPNGVFNRLFFRKIADAEGQRNDIDARITQRWAEAIARLPKDMFKGMSKKVYDVPGVIDGLTGETQRLTWEQKMSLAGHRGDASAFAKLLRGEGWEPKAVLDFLDKNMTREEWDFIRSISDTFQEIFPLKQAMLRRLGNTAPPEVDRLPFETRHGTMPGWYWPITYDPARSETVRKQQAERADRMFQNDTYSRADTSTGRENTRNENYAKPVLLSLDVLPRVLKDEIRDISTREALVDAHRFMTHPPIRQVIEGVLSKEHWQTLFGWLQAVANDAAVRPSELQFWDNLAHGVRSRTTMVGLGFRFSTMVMHGATAALESVAELGPVNFAKGIFDMRTAAAITTLGPEWMQRGLDACLRNTDFEANRDFIFDRSDEMRHRMNETERDIREQLREIHLKLMDPATNPLTRARLAITARAYQGIAMLDMASAIPTWIGAYCKALAPAEKRILLVG